jgi:hypothetical protein
VFAPSHPGKEKGCMKVRLVKQLFVGSLLFLVSCSFGTRQAKADGTSETMDLTSIGSGPNGNEDVTGTFLFNPTTGTFSDGHLTGTGLISETWTFGTEAGTAQPGVGTGYYSLALQGFTGSQGDDLFFVMLVDGSGGYIPPNGGGGGPNLFSIDSWTGQITDPGAAAVPEPSSFLLLVVGSLLLFVIAARKAVSL